jgi:amidophosphoribosyltransferase
VVLVDDSIVRGTTSGRIVRLLREAGALEVHMRVSAPQFLYPCYYGTDIDSKENLIACKMDNNEIARHIGADSLGYLPIHALDILSEGRGCCQACFDGSYPTKTFPDMGRDRFERHLSDK